MRSFFKLPGGLARAALVSSAVMAGLLAGEALTAVPAAAADLPSRVVEPVAPVFAPSFAFFTRIGASGVFSDARINSVTSGVPIVGSVALNDIGSNGNVAALYVEGGIYITPNIAVSVSGGYPPTITTTGKNALAGTGPLASAVVGLPTADITYHLTNFGAFRPYAGVGVGYAIVFHDSGAFLTYPALRDHVAFVLDGGIDYALGAHWSVFVDVKKAFLTQSLVANAPVPPFPGTYPTTVSVKTDPLIVSAGLGYRF